ncbi:MAG: NUDIX hydrolase [Gammaproteobacteria bacterium]|nr:MAG: NUDIX hydrolase [Gammaproteobacteria bacterium]
MKCDTWKPHVTVASIVEKDNRFLCVKELIDGKEVINQPAGHLDPNESLFDAVIRETQEETGYTVKPEYLVGIYQWKHPEKDKTFLRFVFSATVVDHNPEQELDDGILEALWPSEEELKAESIRLRSPMVLQGISDYKLGKRFPVDLIKDLI